MDKYTHFFSGFPDETSANNWGEIQEKFLMQMLAGRIGLYATNIKTQPNSMTGLWTCTVTAEKAV